MKTEIRLMTVGALLLLMVAASCQQQAIAERGENVVLYSLE